MSQVVFDFFPGGCAACVSWRGECRTPRNKEHEVVSTAQMSAGGSTEALSVRSAKGLCNGLIVFRLLLFGEMVDPPDVRMVPWTRTQCMPGTPLSVCPRTTPQCLVPVPFQ